MPGRWLDGTERKQFVEDLNAKLMEWGAQYGMQIIGALAILVIGWIVTKIITGIVRRLTERTGMDATLSRFLIKLTKIVLLIFVFLAALGSLGVETTSFIAIIGAAGLAIGFALQGSLSNFAAGIMLIAFRPFKAGDYVEAAGTAGTVEEVGIFVSIFRTPDNKEVIIPNSGITGGNIINYSAKDTRRIDMVFGIGYDDDIKLAKQTLEEIVTSDERVLKDPAPTIAVSELADSSVNFVCRPWVKTADYWGVLFDVHEKVKQVFDEKGIGIPFPQRDIHVYEEKAS